MKMEAAIFFDSYLPYALRGAQEYAGEDGFVASMPQLLHARVNAPYDNIIWNTWFNPNSEKEFRIFPDVMQWLWTLKRQERRRAPSPPSLN